MKVSDYIWSYLYKVSKSNMFSSFWWWHDALTELLGKI